MLYEVAFIEKPTKKQRDETGQGGQLLGFIRVCAKDENTAQLIAIRDLGDKLTNLNPDRLEVLIRPFCEVVHVE